MEVQGLQGLVRGQGLGHRHPGLVAEPVRVDVVALQREGEEALVRLEGECEQLPGLVVYAVAVQSERLQRAVDLQGLGKLPQRAGPEAPGQLQALHAPVRLHAPRYGGPNLVVGAVRVHRQGAQREGLQRLVLRQHLPVGIGALPADGVRQQHQRVERLVALHRLRQQDGGLGLEVADQLQRPEGLVLTEHLDHGRAGGRTQALLPVREALEAEGLDGPVDTQGPHHRRCDLAAHLVGAQAQGVEGGVRLERAAQRDAGLAARPRADDGHRLQRGVHLQRLRHGSHCGGAATLAGYQHGLQSAVVPQGVRDHHAGPRAVAALHEAEGLQRAVPLEALADDALDAGDELAYQGQRLQRGVLRQHLRQGQAGLRAERSLQLQGVEVAAVQRPSGYGDAGLVVHDAAGLVHREAGELQALLQGLPERRADLRGEVGHLQRGDVLVAQ
mmetsp:Transcript_20690/g.54825  ORF Transcript_20690/g.54825 Transcript_20690/m.54825 type:complete len:444 (-) Transcript_20690:277-1608(-)